MAPGGRHESAAGSVSSSFTRMPRSASASNAGCHDRLDRRALLKVLDHRAPPHAAARDDDFSSCHLDVPSRSREFCPHQGDITDETRCFKVESVGGACLSRIQDSC